MHTQMGVKEGENEDDAEFDEAIENEVEDGTPGG